MLFGTHVGPGAFYKLMPHNAMALLFGLAFLYAIVALAMGLRAFWRAIGDPVRLRRAHGGRRCAMPAQCAISMAAASAATITMSARTTGARSIIT